MTDVWAPLGVAGSVEVVDEITHQQFATLPATSPHQHRCDLVIAGIAVDVSWRLGRVLMSSIAEPGGSREIVSGKADFDDSGPDTFLWHHSTMPLAVLGDAVAVERERSGRDRWAFRVDGPGGRTWTWRPGGTLLADRMELTRAGDKDPVVTHTLRPVPAHPRSPAGPPTVSWRDGASLVEVLMPVMWVLERAHKGLLPKAQRIARMEFL